MAIEDVRTVQDQMSDHVLSLFVSWWDAPISTASVLTTSDYDAASVGWAAGYEHGERGKADLLKVCQDVLQTLEEFNKPSPSLVRRMKTILASTIAKATA